MSNAFGRLLRFLSRLDSPVDRRTYCLAGFSLAAIKYAGDVALFGLSTGRFWKPTDYLRSTHSLLWSVLPGASYWLLPALLLWLLPFLWIGVALTLRRSTDAGISPWWTMIFFVPYLNYALMAALCLAPTSSNDARFRSASKPGGTRTPNALRSIGAGVCLGIVMVVLGVLLREQYGFTTILGGPFGMGALTAFLFNRGYSARLRETIMVTIVMFLVASGVFLLLALEGALCIAMMLPIGLAVGLLGALVGRAIALCGQRAIPPAISAMLLLPVCVVLEPAHVTGRMLHEVQSSVIIEASPEKVWPHVIAFEPIAEPTDMFFRLGIAYPRYAHIEGSGVGAVRYCVFSTGAFVEPITDWEPGKRLGFGVASSPDPLRELSIYANLSPPHLHGYLRSRRGEFRLVSLPGGRTRLEGSTWYEIQIAPEAYWRLWSDFLIHRIHDRVLEHIKLEVGTSGGFGVAGAVGEAPRAQAQNLALIGLEHFKAQAVVIDDFAGNRHMAGNAAEQAGQRRR
jgi:uncharacterized membrane protein YhaH (DUF805 family)